MVLFMPTETLGTHAATCDRVVLVLDEKVSYPPTSLKGLTKVAEGGWGVIQICICRAANKIEAN